MKRQPNAPVILAMGFALVAAVGFAAGEPAQESPQAPEATAAPTSEDGGDAVEDSTPGVAGLRVYLDPETGELRSPPAEQAHGSEIGRGDLTPHERLNTYGGDLLQERLEKGGFKVDLRGRFQRSVVATIDPETDEVSVDCVSDPVIVESMAESEAADDE